MIRTNCCCDINKIFTLFILKELNHARVVIWFMNGGCKNNIQIPIVIKIKNLHVICVAVRFKEVCWQLNGFSLCPIIIPIIEINNPGTVFGKTISVCNYWVKPTQSDIAITIIIKVSNCCSGGPNVINIVPPIVVINFDPFCKLRDVVICSKETTAIIN